MPRATRSRTTRGRSVTALVVLALVVAACSTSAPPGPVQVERDGITATVVESARFSGSYACTGGAVVDVRVVVGTTEGGSDFVLVRPAREWNEDLIVFAHGYRDPALPIDFWQDAPNSLPGLLAELGAADQADLSAGVGQALELAVCPLEIPTVASKTPTGFAASSYSANGDAVEEGVPESHIVAALFERYFGPADRNYATGASLGGIIALKLAETYPARYDGALPVCGPVGGNPLQLHYVTDVELMFRRLYPGVFDGDVLTPIDLPYGDADDPGEPSLEDTIVNRIVDAVSDDPTGLDALARVEVQHGGPRRLLLQADPDDAATRLSALLDAFYYAGGGKEDILSRVSGAPFDNQDAVYELDGVELSVPRYAADPDATAYYADHYLPSGDLQVETITVHNRYDPVVPAWHEAEYERLVGDAGRAGNLLTVVVPLDGLPTGTEPFGHCGFAPEVVAAFAELSTWVETGVRPTLPGTLHAVGAAAADR